MPKLSHKEFVERAVICLRKEGYKGIHSVYSGFNEAFKKYFDGENPVAVTKKLADEGHIYIRLAKGGALLYLSKDVPHYRSPEETLALILEKTNIKQPNILKEKALSLVDTAKKQFPTVKEKTIDYLITRGWNAASFKKT